MTLYGTLAREFCMVKWRILCFPMPNEHPELVKDKNLTFLA